MISWEPLGGDLAGAPGACTWGVNRLDVFMRGQDNACWHKWYDNGWSDWETLGGGFTSDLSAACWASGRIDVFGRGLDNALWHRSYENGWSDWTSLGGDLAGAPGACTWGVNRLDVFMRGQDNACWHKWYDNGWSDWETLGGGFTSDLSAACWASGRIDVFGRGLDNALWHRSYENGWSDWTSLGGDLAGAPGACTWGVNRLDVFMRGQDNACWHKWYDNGWSDWETLGGGFTSDLSAACWAIGRIDVFGRGLDNALWHTYYDGTWAGDVIHEPEAALASIRVNVFEVIQLRPQQLPRFTNNASEPLKATALGVGISEDGRRWQSLAGWLNPDAEGLDATVLCRRTGLTIRFEAKGDAAASPLPFGTDSPSATLVYATGTGADRQERRRAMECVVDVAARTMNLLVNFASDDEYGQMVKDLSDSSAEINVEVAGSHQFLEVGPPNPGGGGEADWPWRVFNPDIILTEVQPRVATPEVEVHVVDPPVGGPLILHLPNLGATRIARPADEQIRVVRPARGPMRRRDLTRVAVTHELATRPIITGLSQAEPLLVANDMLLPEVATKMFRRNPLLLDVIRHSSGDFGRIWTVPERPAEGEPSLTSGVIPTSIVRRVFRPRTDVAVYPDLPREQHDGWGQVPDRENAPPLHFKDSPRADVFYFLPTEFRLGFYRGTDPSGEGDLPPIRVTQYLGDDGVYRVKVALVALPYISDADRDTLNRYVREVVLRQTLPFVELEPRAGLRAEFVSDFTAGGSGDQSVLPETIKFSTEEVAADRRLALRFDMEAVHYGIFCELLKKGIRGRIKLTDDGLQESIDVSLRLDRLTTNRVTVEAEGFGEAPPTVAPGAESGTVAQPQRQLKLVNVLSYPVRVQSLNVTCLDRGPVPGMIFDAERLDLLPAERRLEPGNETGAAVALDVAPQRIGVWDDTVVHVGAIHVDAGTSQEWLDRVNRDPTLQPHRRVVKVSTVMPTNPARAVQVMRLKVFATGDAGPRSDTDASPGSTIELVIEQSLAELAASGARPLTFLLEFAGLYDDGELSLPQRVEISPTARELTVPVLIEAPGVTYTVEHNVAAAPAETNAGLDRAAAATLIDQLRAKGELWRVFAKRPATTPTPDTPTGDVTQPTHPDGTAEPDRPEEPRGPVISIVTDLVKPLFPTKLKKVLLRLQADVDGAPTTSLQFDAEHLASGSWQPATAGIPPFRYRVTYILADHTTRQIAGTETGTLLVLDHPPE